MIPADVPCRRCRRSTPLLAVELVVFDHEEPPARYWYAAADCRVCQAVTQYAGLPSPVDYLYHARDHLLTKEAIFRCVGRPRLWRVDWGRPAESVNVYCDFRGLMCDRLA